MTREELFECYVADTLDEAGTSELGALLETDPEFAAQFAKDLLETGMFVEVEGEVQRVPEEEHHPHLLTGDLPEGMPPSLHLEDHPHPPGHEPASEPLALRSPPASEPVPTAVRSSGLPEPGAGVAAEPPPPVEAVKVPPGSVPHHPQPVLKSAQRGVPVAVWVVLGILAMGVLVAVVLQVTREPPAPVVDPVIARIETVEGTVILKRGTTSKKAGAGTDLYEGDELAVQGGEARVAYVEEASWLHLRPGSEVEFGAHGPGKQVRLRLGELTAELAPQRAGETVEIAGRHASVQVLGAVFTLRVEPHATEVAVRQGKVVVERESDGARLPLDAGSWSMVRAEGPLTGWVFHSAVNLNGESVELDGQTWLSHAEALSKGLAVEGIGGKVAAKRSAQSPAGHLPDPALGGVLSTGVQATKGRLSLKWPVPAGAYQVAVWTLEDEADQGRSLRLNLEEKSAAKGMGEDQALGEWTRFGPFPVTVEDGELEFLVSADATKPVTSPHLMGFAVYRQAGR